MLSWAHTSAICAVCPGQWLIFREEGVVALHLPIESLKTCSVLEPLRTRAGNEMKIYITHYMTY